MNGERYVLLGLAPPRAPWFRSVAQWANAAALPAEFVKCVSPDEARLRIDGGRPFSALLVDAGLPGVDRDLITTASLAGCPTVVVDDQRVTRDWFGLGATAVLAPDFGRAQLADTLAQHCRLIERTVDTGFLAPPSVSSDSVGHRLIAVTGAGGAGVSTIAIAVAQALASLGDDVVLADLCLHAEQAMLHDGGDASAGLQALVEAHRAGRVSADGVRELCLGVPSRGYDLLPGLRRARFWSTIRPVAFGATLNSLRSTYATVVCDVDADVETEEAGGSMDVEERTSMARTVLSEADAVLVVGSASMKGLHSLNRILVELGDIGVSLTKALVVFNQAPRSPKTRAAYGAALAELLQWRQDDAPPLGPIHLPTRDVEQALRIGGPLPESLTQPLGNAVQALLGPATLVRPSHGRITRLVPGVWRSRQIDEAS